MQALLPVILLVVVVVGAGLFLVLRRSGSGQGLDERLNELAALGEPISLEDLELSQPFVERVIKPAIEWVSNLAQKMTPQQTLEAARHKIELAGLGRKIKPAQFVVSQYVACLGLGGLAIVLSLTSKKLPVSPVIMIAGGFGLGYYLPTMLLTSNISRRQESVLKALPDALDLLTICVEAGLGFDASMSKVAEKWDNELSLAFTRTVQEMQLGKLRREALRDMANSLDVSDLTSFVAAIVQADQLGVSMAKVMRIQSEQMRLKRRQRAEQKAREAPVKIMIPLVFFIFPTILIILLGPAMLRIMASGVFG